MLDLPILRAEARISSRRSSTYTARAAFGLLLLGLFWIFHRSHEEWLAGRLLPNSELPRFAAAVFEWLGVGQALIVMAMLPAMVAGSVAEERSRQTLDGLLASGFSSAAIILDKLAAKMFQIGVFLAVGMPIVCLLGLLGGIDPRSIVYAYGGTASTAFFLAAFSLLVSVHARRPRGAILLVYLIEAVWLVGPWITDIALLAGARRWVGPLALLNDWIFPVTPLSLVTTRTVSGWNGHGPIAWLLESLRITAPGALIPGWTGRGALTVALERMIAWQLAAGTVFLFWASRRLRPVSRRLADAPRRRAGPDWLRGRPRVRPPCGDDPILWKDRYSRDGGATQIVLAFGLIAFGLLTLVRYDVFIRDYRRALDELFEYGYAGRFYHSDFFARERFLSELVHYSVLFYVAAVLVVAVKSATGVTSEREAGTWDGVLNTPLEPAEIVRAKVLGALTRQRAILSLVLAPWLFGLVLGALHPIGLLLAITGLVVFLFFASALGTLFSLRSKTSGLALVRTLGVLLMLNLIPVLVAGFLMRSRDFAGLFGSTVVALYFLPISNHLMVAIVASPDKGAMLLGVLSAMIAAYAAIGWVLCRAAIRRFDAAADRPPVP
jgi:ABC-type transport system involved in multi-copper enzyme maturation permease subunit